MEATLRESPGPDHRRRIQAHTVSRLLTRPPNTELEISGTAALRRCDSLVQLAAVSRPEVEEHESSTAARTCVRFARRFVLGPLTPRTVDHTKRTSVPCEVLCIAALCGAALCGAVDIGGIVRPLLEVSGRHDFGSTLGDRRSPGGVLSSRIAVGSRPIRRGAFASTPHALGAVNANWT